MTAEQTRERIVGAAEVLFARHGYDGTSLRQITERAEVNIAAVNYHFGSKENLLIEVLDRVVAPINEERLRLLDEAESRGTPNVDEVLTAFLLPDLRVLMDLRLRDPALPRFVSRMYSEASEMMIRVIGKQFAETQRRFSAAVASTLPHLGPGEILWRLQCLVGIVVFLFAGVEAPGTPPLVGEDVDADLTRLLGVAVALMTSPVREEVVAADK